MGTHSFSQQANIAILDMTAIFPQVRRNAISPR
jgi:hypothetical protein